METSISHMQRISEVQKKIFLGVSKLLCLNTAIWMPLILADQNSQM